MRSVKQYETTINCVSTVYFMSEDRARRICTKNARRNIFCQFSVTLWAGKITREAASLSTVWLSFSTHLFSNSPEQYQSNFQLLDY